MSLVHQEAVAPTPTPPPCVAPPPATRICVFRVGGELFGMSVGSVREIAVVDRVTPVPRATSCVLGAINVRGTLVSLITIEAVVGLTPRTNRRVTRAIVLAHPTMRIAVAVDEVVDMATVEHSESVTMLDPSTILTRVKNQEKR
jgi:chemotaxis signal transduction protein